MHFRKKNHLINMHPPILCGQFNIFKNIYGTELLHIVKCIIFDNVLLICAFKLH